MSGPFAFILFQLKTEGGNVPILSAQFSVDGQTADSCSAGCTGNVYATYTYYFAENNLSLGQHTYSITVNYNTDNYTSTNMTINTIGPIFIDYPNNEAYVNSENITIKYYSTWNLTDGYIMSTAQ